MERVLKALRHLDEKVENVLSAIQIPQEKGVIKRMDNLGRITIPITYRKLLGIERETDLEISLVDNRIVISKINKQEEETQE